MTFFCRSWCSAEGSHLKENSWDSSGLSSVRGLKRWPIRNSLEAYQLPWVFKDLDKPVIWKAILDESQELLTMHVASVFSFIYPGKETEDNCWGSSWGQQHPASLLGKYWAWGMQGWGRTPAYICSFCKIHFQSRSSLLTKRSPDVVKPLSPVSLVLCCSWDVLHKLLICIGLLASMWMSIPVCRA